MNDNESMDKVLVTGKGDVPNAVVLQKAVFNQTKQKHDEGHPDNNKENKEILNNVTVDAAEKKCKLTEIELQFILAACQCEFEKVNNILSKDQSLVNMKSPVDGFTALHYACKFGDVSLIRALIGNYKADVNIINNNGKTPLHLAVEFNHTEAVRILLCNYDANKYIRDYYGRMPIDCCNEKHLPEMEPILGIPMYHKNDKVQKAASVTRESSVRFSDKLKSIGNAFSENGSKKLLSYRKSQDSNAHALSRHSSNTLTVGAMPYVAITESHSPTIKKPLSQKSSVFKWNSSSKPQHSPR